MTLRSLPLPPIGPAALHVVVDMQRVFAEDTPWRVPSFFDIVPPIRRIVAAWPERTLFTRFITPPTPAAARGRWRDFYRRWPTMTQDVLPAAMLDLVAPLAALARAERVCDKTTFSAFADGPLAEVVAARGAETLVLSGVETDVCVLATALAAVDRGLRVVIVEDAVTSWSAAAHAATLDQVLPRFEEQIELATADALLGAWPRA